MTQEKNHIKIPVRLLVETMLRSGDLSMEFSLSNRKVEGIYAHQKLQKSRPAEYSSEVTVAHRVETQDFILDIGGRIDGVYQYPAQIIVEEIKSTTRSLEAVQKEENLRHWGQLKVYAYIYAWDNQLEEIDIRLTYYQVDTEEILELDRKEKSETLSSFFNDLVERYLAWAKQLEQWQTLRDTSCEELAFPFADYRPGQKKMALHTYHIIETGGRIIAQAPTGIGKTMATLFPTLKALGRGHLKKFFYLTARTTGRTVAEKALHDMRGKGLKLKSLTLTAKDKICFTPGAACNGEECEYAKGYYDRVDQALAGFFVHESFTRPQIETLAKEHRICPFEFSLELSLWADGIICDYNYAFDPAVYLRRFFGEDGLDDPYVFLIDEAHNLVDRAREMFSSELNKKSFLTIRTLIKGHIPGVYKAAGKINKWMLDNWKECQAIGRPIVKPEQPEELYGLLRAFTRATEKWLSKNLKTSFLEDLLTLFFEVNRFLRTAEGYGEDYTTLYQPRERDLFLKLYCMDPSRLLAEALERCKAAIFFSATMTPSHYFRKVLGCGEKTGALILPSPFPAENLCILMSDRISTRFKERDKTRSQVNLALWELVTHKSGNYLLFFPSYKYMRSIHELFLQENGEKDMEILIQTPGMSEEERDVFLEKFSSNNGKGSTLVGFAVMGGIFGEGIDLVGDRLTGAAIVGVGLPGICLERDLIRDYFSNHGQQSEGFEYAYLFPGFNRVLQAAGRVIRSEKDRGVVLLIDDRFARHQYRSLFPMEWNPRTISGEKQIHLVLEGFWGDE